MAGFGRREIELMQALCIYNRYIECYSVVHPMIWQLYISIICVLLHPYDGEVGDGVEQPDGEGQKHEQQRCSVRV